MAASSGLKANYYTINAAPMPSTLGSPLQNGECVIKGDFIAFDASNWDSGTTFYMARLPKNSFLIMTILISDAMTNAVTGQIGDGTTAGRFGSWTTLASASKQVIPNPDLKTLITADTDILCTTGGANCGATGNLVMAFFILIPQNITY